MKWKHMLSWLKECQKQKLGCYQVHLTTVYVIIISIFFDLELQLISTKPVVKKKLKDLLGQLKKFKIQTVFFLEYKKIDDQKAMRKIFRLHAKLIVNDGDNDKTFEVL